MKDAVNCVSDTGESDSTQLAQSFSCVYLISHTEIMSHMIYYSNSHIYFLHWLQSAVKRLLF